MKLHGYFRSSAAYRVRIALNLKGLAYEPVAVNLVADGQHAPEYEDLNPQALVPVLQDGDFTLGQSLAIIEYLDERQPQPPLLPADLQLRALARRLAYVVACEVHPLNNLRVKFWLAEQAGVAPEQYQQWYAHWIHEGFGAMEAMLRREGHAGTCCIGDTPSLADICLVPQMYNARRFDVPLDRFPMLCAVDEHCRGLPAFADAAPEQQADAG